MREMLRAWKLQPQEVPVSVVARRSPGRRKQWEHEVLREGGHRLNPGQEAAIGP